jgi:hypothetical protein
LKRAVFWGVGWGALSHAGMKAHWDTVTEDCSWAIAGGGAVMLRLKLPACGGLDVRV